MAVDIKLKLSASPDSVKKVMKQLEAMSKKGIPLQVKTDDKNKKKVFDETKTYLNKLKQNMMKGASWATQATSGLSQFIGGGFFTPLMEKVDALNKAWSGIRKGVNKMRLAYHGLNEKGKPYGTEDTAENGTGAGNGTAGTPKRKTMPESAQEHQQGQKSGFFASVREKYDNMMQKGGVGAAIAGSVPIIGQGVAAALGGILKIVSDVGQQHVQARMSQQGTIGATGSYVSHGGEQFSNAEMAAAQIAKARAGGLYGNDAWNPRNKRGKIGVSNDERMFAAQQNMGLGQFVQSLGEIKEQDHKVSIQFLRGAANLTRMTGLKQGQFVQQIQQYSNQLRSQGYTGGLGGVMGLGAGLAQNIPGMKGERAMKVAQGMDTDVRKGAEGSSLSQMAIIAVMKKHNMGYFEAAELFEEQGMGSDKVRGAFGESMEQFSPEVRGELMRSMGLTRREGRLATSKSLSATINPDTSPIKAGGNKVQDLENTKMKMFATNPAAEKAAQLGYTAAEASMKMFENFSGPIGKIADTLHSVEISLIKSADSLVKMAEKGMSYLPQ